MLSQSNPTKLHISIADHPNLSLPQSPSFFYAMDAAWTRSPEEVLQHFNVDPNTGLSPDHVAKNREIYGKNGT